MPRYFFHFRHDDFLTEDFEGEDLADVAAAEETARASVAEVVAQSMFGAAPAGYAYEVCDEAGLLLLTMPFSQGEKGAGAAV
jgi:hypothetical protein